MLRLAITVQVHGGRDHIGMVHAGTLNFLVVIPIMVYTGMV